MAKTWAERLANLSVKLDELSKKTAEASEDAKAYRELRTEAIQDRINTAKGNVAAMQENARMAEEEREGKFRSAMLKIRMTAQARHEDYKDARDKKRLERFIDDEINYILDCYDAAALLIADADLSIYEVAVALKEYEERFGAEPETAETAETAKAEK
jgi:Asp-tRNA(Asn)/Glu-tRNA(Gln) amidotransferase A subunit family amidase